MRSRAAANSIIPDEASRMRTCVSAVVVPDRSLSSMPSASAPIVPSRMMTSTIHRKLSTAMGPSLADGRLNIITITVTSVTTDSPIERTPMVR